MNLSNLQTFLAIVETGSLIRASEQLNVTQSTVTARLKSLEETLGQTLFVRHKTGATLTARGVKLRRYAEVMLELWHQARQETSLPEGVAGLVNIGCQTDLRAGVGQGLLNAVRALPANFAVSAWSGSDTDLGGWMNSGLVDLAVTYHTATEDGFRLHRLQDEHLVLVSSDPDSPMRFDPNYIFVEGGEQFGRDHAAYYADAGTAQLSFGSATWALEHILSSGGSAYLPHRMVSMHLESEQLYLIADAPKFIRKTYLVVNEKAAGGTVTLIPDASGKKANLFATIGPQDRAGVMLSGHTDVVPVAGQNWTKPPFALTSQDGKYYGRGTCDMKGFVAAALSTGLSAAKMDLQTPLHLAFSYDEEIGCIGVRSLVDMLEKAPIKPAFCIVGEPTSMQVAIGHKGKMAAKATMIGREGHSALAPQAVNAIYMAVDFITMLRDIQSRLMTQGAQDEDYSVPYTTLHVGQINAGVALNIVPNRCDVLFEIRSLSEDNPDALMEEIKTRADEIAEQYQDVAPESAIEIVRTANTYPGLSTPAEAEVVRFVKSLLGANDTMKVPFGTEGGLFSDQVGIPTVVCGPGSMEQGHKPDEYVSADQLAKCDAMLAKLLVRLKDENFSNS